MTTELAIREESHSLTEQINKLVIVDQASFETSGRLGVDLQKMKKVIEAYHKPLTDTTNKAHKAATKRRNDDLAPLDVADIYNRGIRSSYVQKEQEKQVKAQKILDDRAEKKAERERERLRAKAEAEKDPEIRQELEEKVEEVYVQPNIAPVAVPKSSKVVGGGGSSWVDEIEVTVTDETAVMYGIIEGKIPPGIIEFKPAKIKAWVKTMSIKNGQIKGIRITTRKVERVRTA